MPDVQWWPVVDCSRADTHVLGWILADCSSLWTRPAVGTTSFASIVEVGTYRRRQHEGRGWLKCVKELAEVWVI